MRRTSLNDHWSVRPKVQRFAELMGETRGWTPVTLPHDAMIGGERTPSAGPQSGYFPGGSWEYVRTLEVAGDDTDAVVLEFEGIYRDAVVSVNGTLAARRPYGYSNFFVPVDHLLRHGAENELRVEVRGRGLPLVLRRGYLPERVAPPVRACPPRSGRAAGAHSRDRRRRGRRRGRGRRAERVGRHARSTLSVELLDADGAIVARTDTPVTTFPGDTITARLRLHVSDPRRWSLDDPNLYTCHAALLDDDVVVDEESTTFGIRSLAVDAERGLRINGEPVLLRGACVHHDNGVLGAASIDRADERRVELLRAAGFNALRSAHNPMSTAMLNACDRLGMLVMDETFDMWIADEVRGRLHAPLRRLVGGRRRGHGAQGRQPPERHPLQHRQRGAGRVDAGRTCISDTRWPRRCARSTTLASSRRR